MSLTKEQLLAARPPVEPVEVPGLGTVFVRVMKAGERDRFESQQVKDAHTDFRARLILLGACAEDGTPLFAAEDLRAVGELPDNVAEPIVDAVLRVNKMRTEDVEAARKNSAGGSDSGSAAASPSA